MVPLRVLVVALVAAWALAPLAHAAGTTTTTFGPSITGTSAQCAAMVAENESWERRDTGKIFRLQSRNGRTCISFDDVSSPAGVLGYGPSVGPCPTIPVAANSAYAWSWKAGTARVQNIHLDAFCKKVAQGELKDSTRCKTDSSGNPFERLFFTTVTGNDPKPFVCTCGFRAKTIKYSPPPSSCGWICTQTIDYSCEDVDECGDGPGSVTCPADASCTNTPGSYRCECNVGFGKTGSLDETLVAPTDSCSILMSSFVETFSTQVNVRITEPTLASSVKAFELEVDFYAKVTNHAVHISRLTGQKLNLAQVKQEFYEVQDLTPGTKHQLRLYPLNSVGARIANVDFAVQTVTTPCRCPGDFDTDATGKPGELAIFQDAGFVTFTFLDLSMCEEAYAFSRSELGTAVRSVFTSNYYYFSRDTCARDPYTPGKEAADELAQSQLAVGGVYTYCVRAVAKGYMPTTDSSNEECADHTVRWEASVDGRVALEKAAGSLPVEGVAIQWELLSSSQPGAEVIASGNATSDESGRFKVALSIVPTVALRMTNDAEYPLRVNFAKTTASGANNFAHTFLCDDGAIRCTDTGTTMFLRHLDFDAPLDVVDDSSVALTGKVVIGGTDVFDPTGNPNEAWNEDGCPVVGAEVCLVDHTVSPSAPDVTAVCVETDGQGEYSLPAVIGTIVHPEVTMLGHTFLPLDGAMTAVYETGITIKGDQNYRGHDFKDESTNPVLLELAGGMCDVFLGDAVFRVTKPGCDWPGVTLTHSGVSVYHRIIAHDVEVAFEQVTDRTSGQVRFDIADALVPNNQNIDLRELESEVEASSSGDDNELATVNGAAADQLGGISADDEAALEAEEQEAEEDAEGHRLRFQFDGTPVISVEFVGDQRRSCGASDTAEQSFHVLRALSSTNVTIAVVQNLGENVPSCDHLPPDFNLNMVNELGLSPDTSTSDEDYIELLKTEYGETDERIALFEKCNKGCNFAIEHFGSVEGGDIGGAHITSFFLVGPPNILDSQSFLKQLRINTVAPYAGTGFVADVLVTGDYDQGNLFSFPAPTHKPIMVLRDPPGSGSYAVYENVQTTSQVILRGHETFVGFTAALDLTMGGDAALGTCIGVGLEACTDVVRSHTRGGVNAGGGGDFEVDFEEDTNTATFTSTWSYTTSKDFWNPGQYSDVFVVPTLNVRFNQIQEIRFDDGTCAGVKPPATRKFDVDAPAERAVAFLTYLTLTEFELPEMRRIVADKEARLLELTPGATEHTQVTAERDQTQAALDAWTDTLASYEATNALAADNDEDSVKPHEWFDSKAVDKEAYKDGFEEDDEALPGAHWSGLVPESLNAKRESLDPTKKNPDLEETNVISFDGGGTELSFWLSQDKATARKHKFGSPQSNSEGDFHFTPHFVTELNAAYGVGLDFEAALTVHHESQQHYSENSALQTKVGFVLSDDDIGDIFDVRVNLDVDYGTFIFTTTGGQSKCPHESGTNRRESPSITVIKSPQTPVLPDEPMVFHLRLANEGVSSSSFQLATDLRDNGGQLGLRANGGLVIGPHQYDLLEAGQTVETVLTVSRGPELFEYPPVRIIFRSACEFVRNIGEGNLLVDPTRVELLLSNVNFPNGTAGAGLRFEEPCPAVSLAGQLARDGEWLINADDAGNELVTVVVRNPSTQVAGSFFDQANDTFAAKRLQKVELLFRKQGAVSWDEARIFDVDAGANVDIDFAKEGVEDPYGFGTISWDVTSIADGDYEIMVRTVCDNVDGAQPGFNKSPTHIVPGTIDRQRPRQYGLPSPAYGDVYVGQDVSFTFQEEIDCRTPYRFALDVQIGDLDLLDKDDLLIVCEDRTISFRLDPTKTRLDKVVGLDMRLELSNVKDMHLNEIAEPIEHSLSFAAADPGSVLASFELTLDVADCAAMLLDLNATMTTVVARILDVIAVDESRVHVASVRCSSAGNTLLEASVTINPEVVADEGDGERRLRSLQDGNHDALHLVYALKDGAPGDLSVGSVVVAQVSDVSETSSVVYMPNPVEVGRDGQLADMMVMMAEMRTEVKESRVEQKDSAAEVKALKGGLIGVLGTAAMGGLALVVVLRRRRKQKSANAGALFAESGFNKSRASESRNPIYDAEEVLEVEDVDPDQV